MMVSLKKALVEFNLVVSSFTTSQPKLNSWPNFTTILYGGSGVLRDTSCHTGRGQYIKDVTVAFDIRDLD